MLQEALGLVGDVFFGDNLDLLDLDILLSLAAAEESTPDEDGNVSHDHSQEAGCDSHHDTNEDGDNDVHNDALKNSSDSVMLIVVTVWSVRSRTSSVGSAVVAMGLMAGFAWWSNSGSTWKGVGLGSTALL